MRIVSARIRRSARRGIHRPATFLVLARIPDPGIAALTSRFTDVVAVRSGESREPHITLFGPFGLVPGSPEDVLLDRIREAAAGSAAVSCRIGGPLRLRGRKGAAIALSLTPDPDLLGIYRALVRALYADTAWCTWIDRPPGSRIFHLSLRVAISRKEAPGVWKMVQELPGDAWIPEDRRTGPELRPDGCGSPLTLYRIALLRRGTLWKEFDLARGTWLSRAEAFNPGLWTTTRREYRVRRGLQLTAPVHRESRGRFVISDLHLGHTNIIRYCRRPFSSVIEMDAVLLDNWNFTVQADDDVIYLGDLRYGRGSPPATHFLDRLHGTITLVAGNHDEPLPGALPSLGITHQGLRFLCIHDPGMVPDDFRGWVIHGHIHNNDLDRYPFINGAAQTINVSAELVDYTPVSLDEIAAYVRSVGQGEKVATIGEARRRFSSGG
ncbi:MAG: hypothetical protein GKC07_02405 [Methanomicrobiales archaeon]|nr:hypothetical protein [Methanomicrobiales archaeon]